MWISERHTYFSWANGSCTSSLQAKHPYKRYTIMLKPIRHAIVTRSLTHTPYSVSKGGVQHTPEGRLLGLTARSTRWQSVNTKQFKGAWEIDPPDNRQFLCSDDSRGQPNNHKNEKIKRESTAEKLWFESRCTGYYCTFTRGFSIPISLSLSV